MRKISTRVATKAIIDKKKRTVMSRLLKKTDHFQSLKNKSREELIQILKKVYPSIKDENLRKEAKTILENN